jgi:hypothetical protein
MPMLLLAAQPVVISLVRAATKVNPGLKSESYCKMGVAAVT